MQAVWIKPAPGHTGNHVFINGGEWVFDYHGYSAKPRFLAHIWRVLVNDGQDGTGRLSSFRLTSR